MSQSIDLFHTMFLLIMLIKWIKFIFTNNHKMSNVYADSFGICEKWLIYYTMIKYFHFLFKLIFLGKAVALTMAIFHS